MHCPSCRTDNPADASFCEQCGTKLELVCPACKTALSLGARFCKKCGTAAAPGAASLMKSNDSLIRVTENPVAEDVDGERKTVTASLVWLALFGFAQSEDESALWPIANYLKPANGSLESLRGTARS